MRSTECTREFEQAKESESGGRQLRSVDSGLMYIIDALANENQPAHTLCGQVMCGICKDHGNWYVQPDLIPTNRKPWFTTLPRVRHGWPSELGHRVLVVKGIE